MGLFSNGRNVELTINQISKLLGKSYAFANKYCHQLKNENILIQKVIGSAILCTLNYENEITIGILTLVSLHKKSNYLNRHPRMVGFIDALTNRKDLTDALIFLDKSKITIVHDSSKSIEKTKVISWDSFDQNVKYIDFLNLTLLSNQQKFWSRVAKTR